MKHYAYAVVPAWRRSRCAACGDRIEAGDPAGFVREVGPCCPGCYETVDRQALVLDHLHMVEEVARHLRIGKGHRDGPVDRDDLIAAGQEALVRAAQWWQPDCGSAFVAVAWSRITWAMQTERQALAWRRRAQPRDDRTLISMHATFQPRPGEPATSIADTLADPVAPGADADLSLTVRAAVARLPRELREVAELCWLEDLEQKQAARRLGVCTSTVSKRLQLAGRRLALALADLADTPEEVAA
jgi:RNA polymerase sigma factor (sigma-70 family)